MPRPIPAVAAVALVSPTPVGSRRGCRSSSAALAALSAAPVETPWIPRATNSQAAESATMNRTVAAISPPSATSSTGRRPTSSETLPTSSRLASTPKA